MPTSEAEALLDLLGRVEREVAAQSRVFEDPEAYLAGVRDVCARLAQELDRRTPSRQAANAPRWRPTMLDDVLPHVVADLRPMVGPRPLELRLRRTPVPTSLDEPTVRRVVEELVHGAVRRAPVDTPVVIAADVDEQTALLAVEDGGAPATSPRSPGAGHDPLGEVRSLVAACDGELRDERLDDRPGNRVVVRLPAPAGAGVPGRTVVVPELEPDG